MIPRRGTLGGFLSAVSSRRSALGWQSSAATRQRRIGCAGYTGDEKPESKTYNRRADSEHRPDTAVFVRLV